MKILCVLLSILLGGGTVGGLGEKDYSLNEKRYVGDFIFNEANFEEKGVVATYEVKPEEEFNNMVIYDERTMENDFGLEPELAKKVSNKISKDFYEETGLQLFPEKIGLILRDEHEGLGMASPLSGITTFNAGREWAYPGAYRLLMHEVGHMVQYRYFTQDDFDRYLDLREYNAETINRKREDGATAWELTCREVFAEDFRIIFSDDEFSYYSNRTAFGAKTEEQKEEIRRLILDTIKKREKEELDWLEIAWSW